MMKSFIMFAAFDNYRESLGDAQFFAESSARTLHPPASLTALRKAGILDRRPPESNRKG